MRSKFKWIFTLLVALTMQFSFAQEKTISGIVSDATGSLPGANVVVKGTTRGTQTDVDGKYTISAKAGDVLVISYVGMADKTVSVGAASTYNVKLASGTEIDTVVITGLGIKKRVDALTSSTQQVNNKELTQASNPNVVQSLTGKVSGLQINKSSGGVNGTTRIVLRGSRSITGNNEALVVIDNAISTATTLQQLPPEIIESVNILKGSQGAALYGEQGVNGVIIVTTSKGKREGKVQVTFNSAVDFEDVAFLPTRQTKYGQGWFGAHDPIENGGWGALLDGTIKDTGLPQANGLAFQLPYSTVKDNIKGFYKTGITTQNGFSINAGGEDSYVVFSANRVSTDFIVQDDVSRRNNFLLKAGKKIGKFSIDGNVNYTVQKASETDSDLLEDLMQTASNIPVNLFENSGNEGNWTVYFKNPYWTIKNNRNDQRRTNLNGIVTLGYEINKNINVSYVGNVQLTARDTQSHVNEYVENAFLVGLGADRAVTSNYFSNQNATRTFYGDLLVNFDYKLSEDFALKANIGNNVQDRSFRITSQGGNDLDIPGLYNINNVLSPATPSTLDNRYEKSNRYSFLANVDLAFKDYLFLNLTGRNDWSSVLSPENNSFFYPSAGVSFIPTKAFDGMKGKVLNYAKIAASVVRVGNSSAVGVYAINETGVFPTGFPYGSLGSYITNQRPTDKNIRPEFVTTKEGNLNLGFFGNRLTLDASAYISETTDLITFSNVSSASGLAAYQSNIGSMETTGFELDLGFIPLRSKDFTWSARASYSTNKSVITSLADGIPEVNLFLQPALGAGIFAQVGEEFPLIKGTTFATDANGNVIVNAAGIPTRTSTNSILGKVTPDYILGFTNSFEYKGLKLTAVMDYRTGHSVISETKYNLTWNGHLEDSAEYDRNIGFIYPNSVTVAGGVSSPNTTIYTGAGYAANGIIDYYGTLSRTGQSNIIDATAFRVRELSLSYALDNKIAEKLGLQSLRFGVNARNPFTVLAKENKGYTDPESSNAVSTTNSGNGQGYSQTGQYPTTRTVGFSMNLTF